MGMKNSMMEVAVSLRGRDRMRKQVGEVVMFSRMVVGRKWEVERAWLVWEEVDENIDLLR